MASVKTDNTGKIFKAVRDALKQQVLIGIPDTAAARPPEPGQKGQPVSNAVVGYIQEFGDDEKNIPARPFLVPGVRAVQDEAVAILYKGIQQAFLGKLNAYSAALDKVGLMAVTSVKATMKEGSFAPLSDRTIEARARRRYADTGKLVGGKSSRDAGRFLKLRGEGVPDEVLHDADLATLLLDTLSLYKSITYVKR